MPRDYQELIERFTEQVENAGLDSISMEDLAEMAPMDLRRRAEAFFDPDNKSFDAQEDPGLTRIRFDTVRMEAAEKVARHLTEEYAGTGKGFVSRGFDTIQLTEDGSFTDKTFERGEATIIDVEYDWGTMEQIRDDKGRIVTARKKDT